MKTMTPLETLDKLIEVGEKLVESQDRNVKLFNLCTAIIENNKITKEQKTAYEVILKNIIK
jgi:hypothetical protein